ncbi:transcriptional regulator [Actinorhabdospora filicis]|uniref:Transcriptional regulator n=1 Tax=Actinorhabdospora filicis TaxID=1785913 RepID=A0A9W6SJ09_9ACTN|nr:ROK family protein [Actinorhabdospora filicis]GLZ76471.1 transcriptional regulator [Actinorhabdospora filicis]
MRDGTGADLRQLRHLNERAVLAAVRGGGRSMRVADIVAASGLGRTVVEQVLSGLAERGWLAEEQAAVLGPGRPARAFRFRAEAGAVGGLDVGAHGIRAVVTDLAGRVLGGARTAVRPAMSRVERLENARTTLAAAAKEAKAKRPWAIGVATTGQVDRDGRVLRCNAIRDWAGLALPAQFRAPIVAADNDSQLAAMAECRWGAAADAPDFVLLQAGRRTGMALVLDGTPRRGFHAAAGDLSHLPFVRWEAAIEHLHRCPDVPASLPLPERAERAFAEARAGRRHARSAVRRYVAAMAAAAATAVAIADPRLLVLGGTLSRSADVILPRLAEELAKMCAVVPELRASTLDADSAALGGAALALDRLEARLLAPSRGPLPDLGVNSL